MVKTPWESWGDWGLKIVVNPKWWTWYEIFDLLYHWGGPNDEQLERGIRRIDDDIKDIDSKILAVVNAERSRAMEVLLDRWWEYTPDWTVIDRKDKKPWRSNDRNYRRYSFRWEENISLHIPGLEIQTLRKRKVDTRFVYDIRITHNGELIEVTLSHKEYNLLKKFTWALWETVKIINKDRYTLRDLISSIWPWIIWVEEWTIHKFWIPVILPKQKAEAELKQDKEGIIRDTDGNEIPEFTRVFWRMRKNPEWLKRKKELENK